MLQVEQKQKGVVLLVQKKQSNAALLIQQKQRDVVGRTETKMCSAEGQTETKRCSVAEVETETNEYNDVSRTQMQQLSFSKRRISNY